MDIEKNIVFIHPLTDKLKALLSLVEEAGDEFVLYEMDSVAEFVQLIGIMEHSITFSSELEKTKEYLKKTKSFVKSPQCHNCTVFENSYPPHLLSKLRVRGLNQVFRESEINEQDLFDYINRFFNSFEDGAEPFETGIGEENIGGDSTEKDEDESAATLIKDIGGGRDSLFSNLKLKKVALGDGFIGSPFDNLKRKNIKQFEPVLKQLKRKKIDFKPVEPALRKKKNTRFTPVPKELKRRKAPLFNPVPRENKNRRKFEPVTRDYERRKRGEFKPVERELQKKPFKEKERKGGLKRGNFQAVERQLERKRKLFKEVERDLNRKQLDPKKKKELEQRMARLNKKKDLLKRQTEQFEKLRSSYDPRSDKDKKKMTELYEELAKELNSQEFLLEEETYLKQESKTEKSRLKDLGEQIIDYKTFVIKKKSGELKLSQKDEKELKDELYQKEQEIDESEYYYPETMGLEYLILYNDMLYLEQVNAIHLCKLIQFAYQKEFEAPFSVYLLNKDGGFDPIYEGHVLNPTMFSIDEFENMKKERSSKWKNIKIPTFEDETFIKDRNEFIYPYFKDGEHFGFAVTHLKPLKKNHQDAKKVELLSLCLHGVVLESYEQCKGAA